MSSKNILKYEVENRMNTHNKEKKSKPQFKEWLIRAYKNVCNGMIHVWELEIFKGVLKIGTTIIKGVKDVVAFVVIIIFIFLAGRVIVPVEGLDTVLSEQPEETVGISAQPLYEIDGIEGKEGVINAFKAIEGEIAPEQTMDIYSKNKLKANLYCDVKDSAAVGKPKYQGFGFLQFGYISNLKNNDVLVFPNVDFGNTPPVYISVQMAKTVSTGGVVSFYLNEISEKALIAIFDISTLSTTNGEHDFKYIIEKIARGKKITGDGHTIYMLVEQDGINIGNIRFGR